MNERIKELAEQAGLSHMPSNYPDMTDLYKGADFELEKFAELIVKEYEKLLPEICPWSEADKEGPMKGWHVQFVARKYFGVEE